MILAKSLILSISCKCRYQPPLPADQVKPFNEFEDDGGENNLLSFYAYERKYSLLTRVDWCTSMTCYLEGSPRTRGRGRGGRGRGRGRGIYFT